MIALTLSLLSLISAPEPLFSEKIEARVGRQIITSTDLRLATERLQERALEPKSEQTIQKAALDRLIEQALIKEYLTAVNMEVSEQEVDRRINSIRSAQGIDSIEDFRAFIETQGLSFAAFKRQVREQMEQGQFYQVIQRQSLQTITENELKAYYNSNLNQFQKNYEIELQECLVPFGEDREAVLKQVQKYESKPASFDECVQKYSASPSKANKGLIGSFRMGSLREEVEAIVFELNPNQVGKVILPGGVQLLKVLKKKDLGPRDFESVKDEIRKILETQRAESAREKIISQLRSSTFIKIPS